MLDLGACGELFIIFVAILILFGPKEIPEVLRYVGKWVAKFRFFSREVQKGFDHFLTEAEIDDYKRKVEEPFKSDIKENMNKISSSPPKSQE